MIGAFLQRVVGEFGNRRTRAVFRAADAYRDKRMWAEAAQTYRNGLVEQPDAPGLWVQYGHMVKELGRLDEAEEAYLKAFALAPGDADLQIQLGHLERMRGNGGTGESHYRRAADLGSDDPHAAPFRQAKAEPPVQARTAPAIFSHADSLRDAGQWTEAAGAYRLGLRKAPNSFPHWVQLGNMLKEAGDLPAAEKAYGQALQIHGDDPDLQLQLGHLYTRMDRVGQATASYQRAVELGTRDALARSRLAESARHRVLCLAVARQLPEDRRAVVARLENEPMSFARLIVEATRDPSPAGGAQ